VSTTGQTNIEIHIYDHALYVVRYPKSCTRPVKLSIQGHGVGGNLIYFYCLQLLLYQALANDSKNHSFTSHITKNISFFSNGEGSRLARLPFLLPFFNAMFISRPE
jgi:hypothetical protein